jgi:cysteine desulfurase
LRGAPYSTPYGLDFKGFVPVGADIRNRALFSPAGKIMMKAELSLQRAYLDHNATTPVRPLVAEAMARALLTNGNPSSIHAEGRAAKAVVEISREQVARLVGAQGRDVIFTSGGSEANAMVLTPSLRGLDARLKLVSLLLFTATEHSCVREGHRFGPAAEAIPVDSSGVIDLVWLEARLAAFAEARTQERALVSVHLANNETGVIQPVAQVALLARRFGALVHCDAVQAAGKIEIDVTTLGVDALTLSAHKFGGPKGIGALVLPGSGIETHDKLIRGGGQERGWRAGTENVAGIAGFGVAAELAADALTGEAVRLLFLRDALEALLADASPVIIFGKEAERLPNTSYVAAPGLKAEGALILMDLAGVSVSSGSACSSGKVKRSHVLDAMGVAPDLAQGALRFSLGWTTTQDDIERAAEAFAKAYAVAQRRKAAA